jgi:hypothetical protein
VRLIGGSYIEGAHSRCEDNNGMCTFDQQRGYVHLLRRSMSRVYQLHMVSTGHQHSLRSPWQPSSCHFLIGLHPVQSTFHHLYWQMTSLPAKHATRKEKRKACHEKTLYRVESPSRRRQKVVNVRLSVVRLSGCQCQVVRLIG